MSGLQNTQRPSIDPANVKRMIGRALPIAFFGFLPVAGLVVALWQHRWGLAYDMHNAFRPAAEAVLDGRSPYPPPTFEALETRTAWVYLPFAAFLFAPFAFVPAAVADFASMALVALAGAAALWILGVRDGRCYGIALLTIPVLSAIQTANLTLPLALALALVWVTRARMFVPGGFLALTLATKVFLWPVVVWLTATRRYRAAVCSLVASTALVAASWAVLGFSGARDYPEILRLLNEALGPDSYTVFALARDLHAPEPVARAVGLAVAATTLVGCWILGRRGDDTRSFALAIVAALLFSPIVWLHYFALLYVPLAIVHKRLSPLWALPVALWIFGEGHGNGSTGQTAFVLATFAALSWFILRAGKTGPDAAYDGLGVIRAKMRKFGLPSGSSKNSGLTQPSSPARLS
jgi:hypothetical protein